MKKQRVLMLEQSTLTQPTSAGLIRPLFSLPLKNAQIAQLVEQRIENPRVGGSIPPLGTIHLRTLKLTY